MKRSGFFLPAARLAAVLVLATGAARPVFAGEPAKAAPPAPAADPASDDDAKPEQPAPKVGGVSVAQMLRDAAALRALVLKKSPQVAAADARIGQAQADVGTAHLLPNPSADFTVGGIVIGDTTPAKPHLTYADTALFDVGLSQMIEIGKRGPRIEAANARLESAKALAQVTTQDAVGDAREVLGRVAYYAARSAILEEGAASAKKGATIEKAKLDQGGTSGADYDRLTLEVIALEAEAARGKSELTGALANCRALLHAPCDESGAGEDDLNAAADVPAAPVAGDKVETRADILAVRKEADASRAEVDLAHAKAIPDPTVRVGYTRDQLVVAGNQSNVVSVSVTIPLPLFDHGQHDAAKATARAVELDKTATAMTAGATSDLTALRAKTTYLEKAVSTMKKDAIPKAQSVVGVTEKAFTEGQIGLTDLLLARRAYLGLRLSQIDLSYEHFTVRSSLRRALGVDTAAR
jgi:cobalt-zinc-cadmium efflux system outer membrane protein